MIPEKQIKRSIEKCDDLIEAEIGEVNLTYLTAIREAFCFIIGEGDDPLEDYEIA